MLNRAIVAALATGLWAGPAAAFWNGNELYEMCTADRNSTTYFQQTGFCNGYIAGMIDQEFAVVENKRAQGVFCFPKGAATLKQAADIVVGYLRAHPEQRHYNAAWIAGEALRQAFPCR